MGVMRICLLVAIAYAASACAPEASDPGDSSTGAAQETAAAAPLTPAPFAGPVAPRPGEGGSTPELQARIDTLLADMADSGRTTADNVEERAMVLYDWGNALALEGEFIHPDLVSLVAMVRQPNFQNLNPVMVESWTSAVDNFIGELAIRRRDPDAFGAIAMEVLQPGEVVGHISVAMTHTVGSAGIVPGGGYVAPNHFRFNFMEYQTEDPAAPNYVSIASSNRDVRFEIASFPFAGQYAPSLRGSFADRLFFVLVEGALSEGDTVTITFGDTSQGSPGLETVQYANTALRYAVWVFNAPPEAGGVLHALPEPAVPLSGREAVGVRGFIEPMIATGETARLTIRAEDRFRNLASSGAPERWTVRLNGEAFETVETGGEPLVEIEVRFDTLGVKRFTIESEDGRITGEADPLLVEDDPHLRIFWGETHGHSGWAEGLGLVDAYFEFAREQSRLQFVTLSEHDLWMDLGEWALMKDAVNAHHRPGRFETLMGYEWTVDAAFGGHNIVLYRNPDEARLLSRQRYPYLEALHAGLREHVNEEDVIVVPHAHMPGDWTTSDPGLERLVEIASYHGQFEWFGRRFLDHGWEVGFIGSSDDHTGSPGYRPRAYGTPGSDGFGGIAAVFAPTLDRDAIFDAMRDRHTYATNGARIILQAEMDGVRMGARLPQTGAHTLEGQVIGTSEIASVTLVKNGEPLEVIEYDAAPNGPILEVAFHYDSDPGGLRHIAPIPTFAGVVRLEGLAASALSTPVAAALNSVTETAELAQDGQSARFSLRSGGRINPIEFVLASEPEPGARLILDLSDSRLPGFAEVDLEPIEIRLDALEDGPVSSAIGGEEGSSRVVVRRIERPDARERRFTLADPGPSEPGDYYFLRVRQRDGGMAWSSPWWVIEPRSRVQPEAQTE